MNFTCDWPSESTRSLDLQNAVHEAIAELSATPESAAINARQIASHERAIDDAQQCHVEAARNAEAIQKALGR